MNPISYKYRIYIEWMSHQLPFSKKMRDEFLFLQKTLGYKKEDSIRHIMEFRRYEREQDQKLRAELLEEK